MDKTQEDILKANQAFYDAFAAGDYDRLEKQWINSDEISVIHPGSTVLHGRQAVMNSWRKILESSGGSDIRCANPKVYLLGDTAYVICNEVFPEGQLIATNIFKFENNTWLMVHHQAGPDNRLGRLIASENRSVH
jgi:ketosteroid isomerase-like protein